MKVYSWISIALLSILIILLSVLSTFHNDSFYSYGYERNDAYELVGKERATMITEEWQAFLEDDATLTFFPDNQLSHLQDVKGLYKKSQVIISFLIILLSILLVREKNYFILLQKTAKVTLIITGLLLLLGLRWQWFFTLFHKLFFEGNWTFPMNTLIIQLWGGNFFVLAALFVLLKILVVSILLYGMSYFSLFSNDEC